MEVNDTDHTLELLQRTRRMLGARLSEMLEVESPNAVPVASTLAQVVQAEEQLRIRALLEMAADTALQRILDAGTG